MIIADSEQRLLIRTALHCCQEIRKFLLGRQWLALDESPAELLGGPHRRGFLSLPGGTHLELKHGSRASREGCRAGVPQSLNTVSIMLFNEAFYLTGRAANCNVARFPVASPVESFYEYDRC